MSAPHCCRGVTAAGLDPAPRTITWTQTGSGAYDALLVDRRYARTVNDVTTSYAWRVIAPTSTGSLVLPCARTSTSTAARWSAVAAVDVDTRISVSQFVCGRLCVRPTPQ